MGLAITIEVTARNSQIVRSTDDALAALGIQTPQFEPFRGFRERRR